MDTYRAFLAIAISFVILLGYQYFFVGFDQPAEVAQQEQPAEQATETQQNQAQSQEQAQEVIAPAPIVAPPPVQYAREPKDITVDTALYTAVISEDVV